MVLADCMKDRLKSLIGAGRAGQPWRRPARLSRIPACAVPLADTRESRFPIIPASRRSAPAFRRASDAASIVVRDATTAACLGRDASPLDASPDHEDNALIRGNAAGARAAICANVHPLRWR